MESLLKNVIKGGIFILPFLPFLVTDSLFFPFITGKTFVFRIIVELLLIAWVALVLKNRKYLPKRSVLLWALLAFFVVVGLSTAFSLNPSKSFFSNAERMEGMFGLMHVLAIFVMMAGVFKERDWAQFFFVSLVASIGVAIHGIGQIVGWYDTHQGTRVDANFGNSTYFAMYALFMIFFSFLMAHRARRGQYIPFSAGKERVVQWAFALLAVVYAVLLYINTTRGALLGLLAGLFLASLILSIRSRGTTRKVSLVLFGVLLLTPLLFLAVKNSSFVQESPTLKRFADISVSETTTQSRLTIWGMAYEAWKERPILGYGMENFTTIFSQYYEPEMWDQEPWFDRTHNVPIDWLISAGILGLLTYLSLYIMALYLILMGLKQGRFSAVQCALLVGLLAAHFVHNLFVFDYLISYIFFFAVLAYVHVSTRSGETEEAPLVDLMVSRNFIAVVFALVMLLSVYLYNIKPIKAAAAILEGLQYFAVGQLGTQNIQNGQAAFERAIDSGTLVRTEAREQLIIKAVDVSLANLADRDAVRDYIEVAIAEGEEHVQTYPHDMRMRTFLASLYVQVNDHENAVEMAQDLVDRAPTRPLHYLILGEAYNDAEDFDAALEAFETAYRLTPDDPRAQEGYATGLIRAGEFDKAREFMEEQFGSAHPPLARIAQAYMVAGRLNDAIQVAENLIEKEPEELRWRLSLAQLYIRAFRDTEAIEQLQQISELEPGLSNQMNTLIEQIRSGTINRNF